MSSSATAKGSMVHRLLSSDEKRSSLPVSLILTAFGGFSISFFYLGLSISPTMKAAGALSGAYYSLILFMILRSGKPDTWRRVFFVSIALFFFPSFVANLVQSRGHMTVDALDVVTGKVPYCHIVSTMTLIPMALTKTVIFPGSVTGFYASIYSMLTIWLVAALVLGRGWCGWMCFYGGWDDLFSRTLKKPRLSLSGKETVLRRFNQAMLMFVALASMYTFMAVYCVWFCPFKIITEYEAITGLGSYLAAILFISLFVGLVIVLPALTRKRFQCAVFCPMAALNSLVDRVSPFGMRIDAARCARCMACVKACPVMALDEACIREGRLAPLHTCIKCGACVQACPKGAVRFSFRPADFLRRKFRLEGVFPSLDPSKDKGPVWRALLSLGRELLDPRNLFTVTAFILGSTLSFSFAIGTLSRFINLALKGSFTEE